MRVGQLKSDLKEILHSLVLAVSRTRGAKGGRVSSVDIAKHSGQNCEEDHQYREELLREANFWGDDVRKGLHKRRYFNEHPIVREAFSERMKIESLPWEQWVRDYFQGTAELGLDLGCGISETTRGLIDNRLVKRAVGIDISEVRLEEGRLLNEKGGYAIALLAADINTVVLSDIINERVDLVYSGHSFHHFFSLEHICAQLRGIVKPGGLLVLEDYTGPSVLQWTDAQCHYIDLWLHKVPEKYRRLEDGQVKVACGRPTIQQVQAGSPFEAIRSSEILQVLSENFRILHHKKLGGTLLNNFMEGIAHNFTDDDAFANQFVRDLVAEEYRLIEEGEIDNDFSFLVASPS